ncbi:NUDIX hydrolase [Halomicrobium urmianum]|uniref:NUDIX hydrolase n=1 Tax=Halomicrobium urmianum TaxID=1586233 RepID=UPI001CD9DFCC|nr:NUDIX domain-containing protein [Halomicrobium urmianum]
MIDDRTQWPVASGGRRVEVCSGAEPSGASVTQEFRVGAKALVTSRDRVLLIEEQRDDGSTFWTFPGGGVEAGESLRNCLRREVREELQCRVSIDQMVTSCTYRHRSKPSTVTHYAVLGAELETDPDPNPREGIIDCEWWNPDSLPPGTLEPFREIVPTVDP